MKLTSLIVLVYALAVVCVHAQQNHEHKLHTSESNTKLVKPSIALSDQSMTFVCPMHTHIVKNHEGTCPICSMDLVARENNKDTNIELSISGAMQQAMALKTEIIGVSELLQIVKTYGSIQYDETGLSHLHPRTSGWIESLTVNSLGQKVKKGELLYEIYSPELLVAQEDFLSLLSSSVGSDSLLERGRRRLSLLGFNEELISALERDKKIRYRVPYYAQNDGVVSVLNIRQGMFVEPGITMMSIADLSSIWVIADVFENQIDWVEKGKDVELDVPAIDIYGVKGKVEFVYPTLDPVTRTLKVRLVLDNPELVLKPDMLATVRIYAGSITALNIPIDSLIQTEKQNRVFIQNEGGYFERKEVDIGVVTQGRAQVLQGLESGDKVVTSGQFLLDAEASLNNVATQASASPSAHQH